MDIKIVDDFLSLSDLRKAYHISTEAAWNIQASKPNDSQFLIHDVSNITFFCEHIFGKLRQYLDGNYKIQRIYYNGQWSGREGTPHRDGCDATALIYLSNYKMGWGGFTEIYGKNPIVIHPITNRMVLFPGNLQHKGYSYTYQDTPMRVTLAFKLNKYQKRIERYANVPRY